jgi:competence protein ComEA
MKTKKIEQFFKEYFYFSQTERNGVIGLVVIIVFILAAPSIYNSIFPSKPFNISVETIFAKELPTQYNTDVTKAGLFSFNPNIATRDELEALGFSDKNIETIKRYLGKGGKFKKPEDLNKIYGIRPDLVEKLMPFFVVNKPGENSQSIIVSDSAVIRKKYNNQPVELNSADTNMLIALYRIGPGMARRMVDYRDKLGGFLSLNQLLEIYGFDEDILYDLKGKMYVDASKAKIFELNTVTIDELKTHPYFKYKLSNAIVNYRAQHGPYAQLTDLKKIVIVNDSIYSNITQYLRIK